MHGLHLSYGFIRKPSVTLAGFNLEKVENLAHLGRSKESLVPKLNFENLEKAIRETIYTSDRLMPFAFSIRDATSHDIGAIREIHTYYVFNGRSSFTGRPLSAKKWRSIFRLARRRRYPFLVAETPHKQILGFGYVVPWIGNQEFKLVAEDFIFIRPSATGRGIGQLFLKQLIEGAKKGGAAEIFTTVSSSGGEACLALHLEAGFEVMFKKSAVTHKHGQVLGATFLTKSLF
jgi:L-amino acid N-acyltransferase YncA